LIHTQGQPSVTTVMGSQDGRLRLLNFMNMYEVHGWPITDRWHWSKPAGHPWPRFALGACTNALALALVYKWLEWYRKVFFIVLMWLKH